MTTAGFRQEASILKALGHPKRLEIVHLLSRRQLTATDIQRMTGFPQSNLSQHLRELKVARVVVADRNGKNISYRLTHPNFLQLTQVVHDLRAPKAAQARETNKTEVQDPVCGMWVEPAAARWQTLYKGATIFFCASGCLQRFQKTPVRYA